MSKIPGNAKSSFAARMLLSLCAAALTLMAVEAVMRIIDLPKFPMPHTDPIRFVFTDRMTSNGVFYLNQPGRITFRYDSNPRGYFDAMNEVHHDVNPSGFRGPAIKPKQENTSRLVFLGDSFTFGEGVRNEDTYPEVTARLLRNSEKQVESCNLGVGGYNTSQEADVLNMFGFDMQPDAVILGFTLNDAEPSLFQLDPQSGKPVRRTREAFIEAESGVSRRPPDSPIYHLRLSQVIWQSQKRRQLTKQTVDYYLSINSPDNAGRKESERSLREIISQCRERGIPCIVVMFPLLYTLSDDYPFTDIHRQVGEVVRDAGGRYIDLLPALKGMDARELVVHPTDQHPNEKVHAIAGQLVADEIRSLRDSPLKE
jgi:lysophospholipase L1-like esterase